MNRWGSGKHGTGEKWVKVWKENLKRKGCAEDVHIIVSELYCTGSGWGHVVCFHEKSTETSGSYKPFEYPCQDGSYCLLIDSVLCGYLLTYSMERNPFGEANQFLASQEIPVFYGTQIPLPHSQVPATCPCPEPD